MNAALQNAHRFCSLADVCCQSCVRAVLRLFDALATPENGVATLCGTEGTDSDWAAVVELWWQFSVAWGIGGALSVDARASCETPLRTVRRFVSSFITCDDQLIEQLDQVVGCAALMASCAAWCRGCLWLTQYSTTAWMSQSAAGKPGRAACLHHTGKPLL